MESTPNTIIAKGDSGATSHYWRDQDVQCLKNIEITPGPTVTLPNNTTITSTARGRLLLHDSLSQEATTAAILPTSQSSSLYYDNSTFPAIVQVPKYSTIYGFPCKEQKLR